MDSFVRVDACDRYYYEFCDESMRAPDDLDCYGFYMCNNGYWSKQQCSDTTQFDVETFLCREQFVTCEEQCPPYTGAPFPDPDSEPWGK